MTFESGTNLRRSMFTRGRSSSATDFNLLLSFKYLNQYNLT